jgi:hypothetical protein
MKLATHKLALLVGGLLGAATTAPALAQSTAQGLLDNSFVFNAGGFVHRTTTKASLNGESVTNPEIDFEETFGKANDSTRARLDALWRINPRHHLRVMYFDNSNTYSRVLAEDVAWGDYIFKAGSSAKYENQFKVWELAYEYAFLRAPNYEVAATVGAHVTDMSLKLSGTADVLDPNGNVISTGFSTRSADATAPLPVIGIRAGWVVAPQWYIDVQGQIFKFKIDEFDGHWSDVRIGATWMFHRNLGVGLGYNRFSARLDVSKKPEFDGRLKLGYSGLQAYLTGTF